MKKKTLCGHGRVERSSARIARNDTESAAHPHPHAHPPTPTDKTATPDAAGRCVTAADQPVPPASAPVTQASHPRRSSVRGAGHLQFPPLGGRGSSSEYHLRWAQAKNESKASATRMNPAAQPSASSHRRWDKGSFTTYIDISALERPVSRAVTTSWAYFKRRGMGMGSEVSVRPLASSSSRSRRGQIRDRQDADPPRSTRVRTRKVDGGVPHKRRAATVKTGTSAA